MTFYTELIKELLANAKNDYSIKENYDLIRFGPPPTSQYNIRGWVKKAIAKIISAGGYRLTALNNGINGLELTKLGTIDEYLDGFNDLYKVLEDDHSKRLLVKIIAYRVLGFRKVKLPLNTPNYWSGTRKIEELADKKNFIKASYFNWKLPFLDLNKMGIPIQMYFLPIGAYTDFVIRQYEYNSNSTIVKAEIGDYVIDGGGCWGDTALFFANEVGISGKVITHEFIPSNVEILKKNLSLNPELEQRITLVEKPMWESSNKAMYFADRGPGSSVTMNVNDVHEGKVESLSIDEMVSQLNIRKIDFIKMDIEGAESFALKGAIETIRKHKPKLAIAIYHSLNDFVSIPRFIYDLNLGYKLYLAHCSIHEEETILFAKFSER
jgi:FkbM family methyltransferase